MKKFIKILIVFVIFLIPSIVFAVSYVGTVTGTGVYIRKGPGTNYDSIKKTSYGVIYKMPDNNLYPDESNECSNGWYKIYYDDSNNVGYICSNYLKVSEETSEEEEDVKPSSECQTEMKNLGFPSSYWDGLCKLRTNHPNWKFNAINKDDDGNTVSLSAAIKAELNNCSNTISSKAKSEYIRTESTCTNSLDSGYSRASEAAIKYYMDPRNFLTEQYIFMFESQYNNKTIESSLYESAVKNMFSSNYLVTQIPYLPELIASSSSQSGLSGTAIASRIKQELGNAKLSYTYSYDNSALYSVVSGNYTSRTGYYYNTSTGKFVKDSKYTSIDNYYNFYNIAATDGSGVTQKALAYAYKKGWGGTGNQKNDRLTAVSKGATWIYNNYTSSGQQTIYFNKFNTFPSSSSSRYIHQYMTNIEAPVSESTLLYNAYKNSNMLNSAFEFYIPVYNDISYIEISSDNNESLEEEKISVLTALTSAGYKLKDNRIYNINVSTKINDFINKLEAYGVNVTINSKNDYIGTGMKIKIEGATSEEYEAVIYGDVSGDGMINALDLLKVQKHILGISKLNSSALIAADPSKDNSVNALDLLKIQKDILGISKISQ